MTATNGTSEAPPASLSAGAQPDPLVPSSSASHTHSFLDSYTPLHTFSVLLQQTQKRTHALFVNNVGLKPQPFLPAVEEKIKMKLSDEYFFPPLVPPSAAASQVPPDSPPALSVTPPFATLGGQESSEGKPRARLPLALPPSSSPGAAQSSSSNVRKPQSVSVSAPDMTVGDLVAELSAHITCSSGADLPSSSTSHTDPASGRTLALRDEGTAGRSKGSPLNGAALAVTGGSVESVGGGGVLSSLGTGRGELANLRLKNLPAALRPTWHAPWKLHRVISGHLGWVTCLAVDPTNDWFATGSNDRLIKIWDLASGTLKLSLTGHVSAIRDVKISARHPYMFTCGEDNRVKCWDLEQNKVVRDYHGHLSGVYSLALHPQLDILCSGGRDAVVRVWDMRTKHEIYVLSGHSGTVMALQMQSLEPHIISGSQDKMVRLWDLVAGKCAAVLTNHKKSVRAMAFHPREYSFVSCAADKIKVWRCPLGQFERNIEGHNAIVNCCAIKEDGDSSVLIAGTTNGYGFLPERETLATRLL